MDENRVDEVSVGSVDAQQLLQFATSSDNATEGRYQLETSISTNSGNNEQEEGVTSNRSESDYTSLGLAFKTIEETKQSTRTMLTILASARGTWELSNVLQKDSQPKQHDMLGIAVA
ncbi:unnamed protein product [Linum trigynum]|uniref:Uncharacterized protein n=1 Tax=Linum trigynum TaxID=586398 RepID=A0AAV2CDW2_9ROSI